MKILILVFFIITLAYATAELANKDENSKLLYSYICDDEKLQNIEEKLKHLINENDNLRLKLDFLNLIINNQFAELKSTSTMGTTPATQTTTSKSNCAYSYDHLIDVRGSFNADEENCRTSASIKFISQLPTNCAEAFQQSGQKSGIYKIYLNESKLEPFFVNCLADPEKPEAPWTVIQRRQDGSIDFYRNWTDYQKGFGNMEGEFFIGLDKLHALTQSTLHELWIKMEDFKDQTRSAYYSSFAIGNSSEAYALNILGSFKGDAGDSLTLHAGQKFSTHDMDNDIHDDLNCAEYAAGAWWYSKCYVSNLNGRYVENKTDEQGIVWKYFHVDNYSLRYVHMAIRPVYEKN